MGWMNGFQFLAGAMMGCFLFATASRLGLGPTQSIFQWVLGVVSPGVKQPGYEADHSPLSKVNACSYTFTPPYIFMA
jgi:hypothetical protein